MTIRSIAGTHDWEVRGLWHGEQRRLFFGSLFECLGYVRRAVEGN